MRTMSVLLFTAVLAVGAVGSATAQQATAPSYERDVPAKLAAEAKVSEDSARALALARMPGGKLEAVELIKENGKLMWVWDVKTAGKRGITEVKVNAIDGTVVAADEP
jgi:uncharacterized membrane protein YkoI